MKTRKTLTKRVKITKTGKILKKQNRTGHLKRKWSANKKHRKSGLEQIVSKGYRKKFKRLLAKQGGKIK
jgi:ribosomal protein L35